MQFSTPEQEQCYPELWQCKSDKQHLSTIWSTVTAWRSHESSTSDIRGNTFAEILSQAQRWRKKQHKALKQYFACSCTNERNPQQHRLQHKPLMNTVVFQYPNTIYKKCAGELFTRACSDKRRGKGFKLTEGRTFWFYIRKKLSAVRVVRQVAQRGCG